MSRSVCSLSLGMLCWIALAFVASCSARAKDVTPEPSPQYIELVRRALEQYTVGHWQEARALFTEAFALEPNAKALRGLALVAYEAHDYADAIDFAKRALEHKVRPLDDHQRKEIELLAEQARGFVTRAHIVTTPAEVDLRVDGQPVTRDRDGSVLLDPGQHEIRAEARGYEPRTLHVTLETGGDARYDLELQSQVDTQRVASAVVRAPQRESASNMTEIAPWIVIGSSAVVAIAGAVLLAMGEADRARVTTAKAPTTWSQIKGAYERAPTLLAVGGVLLGVGVAGAAAGAAWKVLQKPSSERGPTAQLALTPTGVELHGVF